MSASAEFGLTPPPSATTPTDASGTVPTAEFSAITAAISQSRMSPREPSLLGGRLAPQ